jgi:hypothetical protein
MTTLKQFIRFAQDNPDLAGYIISMASPDNEASIAKGIPIWGLQYMMELNKYIPIRVKYRGPRRKSPRTGTTSFQGKSTCLKADALTFAIYPR